MDIGFQFWLLYRSMWGYWLMSLAPHPPTIPLDLPGAN